MDASRPSIPNGIDPPPSIRVQGRWYRTAKFWKRFSVFASVLLSATSLILSAFASLHPESPSVLRALVVSGIAVNSVSVAIAALTSLDWKKEATHERQFADRLCKVGHVHEGEQIVIMRKGDGSVSS